MVVGSNRGGQKNYKQLLRSNCVITFILILKIRKLLSLKIVKIFRI